MLSIQNNNNLNRSNHEEKKSHGYPTAATWNNTVCWSPIKEANQSPETLQDFAAYKVSGKGFD